MGDRTSGREGGREHPSASGLERAQQRVDRLFERLARSDAPLWSGAPLRDERQLRTLREQAEEQAIEAGRIELLDEAHERVANAYATRLGDMGYWTGLFGIPVPFTAQERADSQAVVRDLITAAVVADLLPPLAVEALRADGEHLLGPVEDEDGSAPAVERTPPRDPFVGPYASWQFLVIELLSFDVGVVIGAAIDGADSDVILLLAGAINAVVLTVLWNLRRHRARARQRPVAAADSGAESFLSMCWRMVVSPRRAMADLGSDPGAGRKGLLLGLIVAIASTAVAVVQRWYGYPVLDPPVTDLDPLGVLVWLNIPLQLLGLALGAAVLVRWSRRRPYGSAFGRVSFASGVPILLAFVESAVVVARLLMGADPARLTTWVEDDAWPVFSLLTLIFLVWWAALTVLAVRSAGVRGRLSTGVATTLIMVAIPAPSLLVFVVLLL